MLATAKLKINEREQSVRNKTQGSRMRYERAQRTLAGGVSSGLRRSARPYPLYFSQGEGAVAEDVDGNRYIDFGLAWGPLILGQAPAEIVEAVRQQAALGLTFGAQHDLEYLVSEQLTKIIPCADLVCYANSGTEIVQVALRLARACTGRKKFLKFEGLSGSHDVVSRRSQACFQSDAETISAALQIRVHGAIISREHSKRRQRSG